MRYFCFFYPVCCANHGTALKNERKSNDAIHLDTGVHKHIYFLYCRNEGHVEVFCQSKLDIIFMSPNKSYFSGQKKYIYIIKLQMQC